MTSSMPPSSYLAEKSYQSDVSGRSRRGSTRSAPRFRARCTRPRRRRCAPREGSSRRVRGRGRWRRPAPPFLDDRNPDAGAESRRFDDHGEAERVLDTVAMAVEHRDAVRDRHALVPHDGLEEVLVHAERRGGHAGADVGDVRELEEALHGAVLAEGPVQDGEDDVDAFERRGRGVGRDGQVLAALADLCLFGRGFELPAPVLADLDGAHVVAVGVEGIDDRARGRDRDVVLARAPAHNHRHPYSGHRLRTYKRRC